MDFEQSLKEYKTLLDKELNSFFGKEIEHKQSNDFVPQFYAKLQSFVMNGGKRLRPIALIEAYKAVKGKVDENIIKASLCVELYHNSTLVQDDLMDEDETRRNEPTFFKNMKTYYFNKFEETNYKGVLFDRKSSRFAVAQAILGGNILTELSKMPLIKSDFDDDKKIKALKIIGLCAATINHGQAEDILMETSINPSEKDYCEMIEKKTGALFVSSIQIGAVMAGASKEQLTALKDYAKLAATAFQLQDDLIDIMPNDKKGREKGSDIRQGKITLLIIKALENASEEQKNILRKALGNSKATEKDVDDAIKVLYDTKAADYVMNLAQDKTSEGKKILESSKKLFHEEGISFFLSFADFMIGKKTITLL